MTILRRFAALVSASLLIVASRPDLAAQSLKLPRNWRVSETTSGGTITGTIGCDLLK